MIYQLFHSIIYYSIPFYYNIQKLGFDMYFYKINCCKMFNIGLCVFNRGMTPALRVRRAVTKFTVNHSLPQKLEQNRIEQTFIPIGRVITRRAEVLPKHSSNYYSDLIYCYFICGLGSLVRIMRCWQTSVLSPLPYLCVAITKRHV